MSSIEDAMGAGNPAVEDETFEGDDFAWLFEPRKRHPVWVLRGLGVNIEWFEAFAPMPDMDSPAWPVWWAGVGRWLVAGAVVGANAEQIAAHAALCAGLARLGARTSAERAELHRLRAEGAIGADVVEAHERALGAKAGEAAAQADYPTTAAGWRSPTEIAALHGVTAHRVGRLLTELGLRENAEAWQPRLSRAPSGKTITVKVWSPVAQQRVAEALGGSQNGSSTHPMQGMLGDGTGSDDGILRVDRQHGPRRIIGGRG